MFFTSLRTLYLLFYLVVASQGLFYFVGVHKALASISLDAFAEQRKAVDLAVAGPLKFIYIGGLLIGSFALLLFRKHYCTLEYITLAIAFLFMSADVIVASKGNIPINQAFHYYPSSNDLTTWNELREQWLRFILIRGGLSVTGLLTLLAGFIIPKFSEL